MKLFCAIPVNNEVGPMKACAPARVQTALTTLLLVAIKCSFANLSALQMNSFSFTGFLTSYRFTGDLRHFGLLVNKAFP